jgi:branched-chain amino acid transport system ATP-binding protein
MAMQSLDRVGVADLADSLPGALPHGSRKRVALARALVAHPRLLLLDEPASGLSENELPELGQLMRALAKDTSLVVIEHRMDLMMSVCDTIFVLDFGKMIAAGAPAQVQSDPAVTAAYLGAEDRAEEDGDLLISGTAAPGQAVAGDTRSASEDGPAGDE